MATKSFKGKVTSQPKSHQVFSKTERGIKVNEISKNDNEIFEIYVEHFPDYKDKIEGSYGETRYIPAVESYKVIYEKLEEHEDLKVGDMISVKGDSKETLGFYKRKSDGATVPCLYREIQNAKVDLVESA